MDNQIKQSLEKIARDLRFRIIENSSKTGTPHLGSCLSCVDLLTYLYWHELKIDPKDPCNPNRDRFILSKGHAAPALFQVLGLKDFYPLSDLDNYGMDGSVFAEHPPTPSHLPGIEAATGSLGHGLPIGLGMAIAGRLRNESYQVHVILGDGECNEGSIWEAAMLASAQKVSNLHVYVDYNKWQATGRSNEIMNLPSLAEKWKSFGWATAEINGHSFNEIDVALTALKKQNKPTAIIANTIKGKGVSFMEDDNNWHYRIPTTEEVGLSKLELGVL